jgi:hypothetical protein
MDVSDIWHIHVERTSYHRLLIPLVAFLQEDVHFFIQWGNLATNCFIHNRNLFAISQSNGQTESQVLFQTNEIPDVQWGIWSVFSKSLEVQRSRYRRLHRWECNFLFMLERRNIMPQPAYNNLCLPQVELDEARRHLYFHWSVNISEALFATPSFSN